MIGLDAVSLFFSFEECKEEAFRHICWLEQTSAGFKGKKKEKAECDHGHFRALKLLACPTAPKSQLFFNRSYSSTSLVETFINSNWETASPWGSNKRASTSCFRLTHHKKQHNNDCPKDCSATSHPSALVMEQTSPSHQRDSGFIYTLKNQLSSLQPKATNHSLWSLICQNFFFIFTSLVTHDVQLMPVRLSACLAGFVRLDQ